MVYSAGEKGKSKLAFPSEVRSLSSFLDNLKQDSGAEEELGRSIVGRTDGVY